MIAARSSSLNAVNASAGMKMSGFPSRPTPRRSARSRSASVKSPIPPLPGVRFEPASRPNAGSSTHSSPPRSAAWHSGHFPTASTRWRPRASEAESPAARTGESGKR